MRSRRGRREAVGPGSRGLTAFRVLGCQGDGRDQMIVNAFTIRREASEHLPPLSISHPPKGWTLALVSWRCLMGAAAAAALWSSRYGPAHARIPCRARLHGRGQGARRRALGG